jgi:hypothetical protein
MRSKITFALIAFTGLSAMFAGWLLLSNRLERSVFAQQLPRIESIHAKPVPSAVESVEFVYKAGEAKWKSATYLFASYSDGSEAKIVNTYTKQGDPFEQERELWIADGIHAEVADHLRVVSAVQSPSQTADKHRLIRKLDPGSGCSATYDRRTVRQAGKPVEAFLGFDLLEFSESTPSMRLTRWLAPALGCAELRQFVEFIGPGGKVTDTSERVAVRAANSEPPREHLAWPASYENVSPAEKYLKAMDRCKCPLQQGTLAALQKHDPDYLKNRYILH